jgi:hypothetical protein
VTSTAEALEQTAAMISAWLSTGPVPCTTAHHSPSADRLQSWLHYPQQRLLFLIAEQDWINMRC